MWRHLRVERRHVMWRHLRVPSTRPNRKNPGRSPRLRALKALTTRSGRDAGFGRISWIERLVKDGRRCGTAGSGLGAEGSMPLICNPIDEPHNERPGPLLPPRPLPFICNVAARPLTTGMILCRPPEPRRDAGVRDAELKERPFELLKVGPSTDAFAPRTRPSAINGCANRLFGNTRGLAAG